MLKNEYAYAITLSRLDGRSLGQVSVTVDWEPALEWMRFVRLRRHLPTTEPGAVTTIQPLWDSRSSAPWIEGFRVWIGDVSADFELRYFYGLAQEASHHFLEKGELIPGERFLYSVAAYPCQADPAQQPGKSLFTVEEVMSSLPVIETSLEAFAQTSRPFGSMHGEDIPVFIPQSVLDEATTLTQAAGALETGGILIGHIHRDAGQEDGDLFLEVTAQIPARHTHAELMRLTFTAETWTDVQAAIDLRQKAEAMVGWWHSHSWLMHTSKEEKKSQNSSCQTDALFLSTDDCLLHYTIFSRAWSIALVISNTPARLTWALFGWRQGMIAHRGFSITDTITETASEDHHGTT